MKKRLKTLLPNNTKTDIAFQGEQGEFPHIQDLVYHVECNVLKKVVMMTMPVKL